MTQKLRVMTVLITFPNDDQELIPVARCGEVLYLDREPSGRVGLTSDRFNAWLTEEHRSYGCYRRDEDEAEAGEPFTWRLTSAL